jgi:putative ABC transport system permease protein
MLSDLRHAFRLLAKSPLFTLTSVLSLAIGIGATTTVFTLADALLAGAPPGVTDPARVVDLGRTRGGMEFDNSSYPDFRDLAAQTKTLTGIYACRLDPTPVALGGSGGAERVYATTVSGNYFQVLGVTPQQGRLFTPDDDTAPGASPVTVLSDRLWRRRFGSDPSIVGRSIAINGAPFTVLGVAPKGFRGTTLLSPDLWAPLAATPDIEPGTSWPPPRGGSWAMLGGRLAPGVGLDRAQAEIDVIAGRLQETYPDTNGTDGGIGWRVARATPVPGEMSTAVGAFMGLLGAIVGLVLAVACINIAGMMLARAVARRRETGVRLALGAGRPALVRQFLAESIVVALLGGAAGLVLARFATALLLAVLPSLPVPLTLALPMNARIALFGLAVTSLAAIATGLVPALQASKPGLIESLRIDGDAAGFGRLPLRQVLVAAQVAGSVLLIVVAGLFGRALQRAASIDPGFDASRVDIVGLDLSLARHDAVTGPAFLRQVIAGVEAIPGVESVSAAIDLPLDGSRIGFGDVWAEGRTAEQSIGLDDWNLVEPGYFRTLRKTLLRGRDFTAADVAGRTDVAIVNEAAAQRLWPGEDPLGRRLIRNTEEGPRPVEVVGVEKTGKYVWLDETPKPFVYLPYAQEWSPRVSLVVRTSGTSAIPAVRALVSGMNPNLPLTSTATLSELSTIALLPQRLAGAFAGALGVVALLIAGLGVYGVTAYSVARRTREFGIRMALGATPRHVLRIVLGQAATMTASGLAIGMLLALASARLLASLFEGMDAADPLTCGLAVLLFGALGLAASLVPARRALAVDPAIALRSE